MNAISKIAEATSEEISLWVWDEKYRYRLPDGSSLEKCVNDTHERVVNGVYAKDVNAAEHAPRALAFMKSLIWCPAGRIHAGAGTAKRVTSINCYVSPDIQDSLMETDPAVPGLAIMDALKVAAGTQQMGGGIGMDFSTLRPDGAIVRRTGSVSTGPLPYMLMWDGMCVTIKSSGSRRGAMMGVMAIWHPDIRRFITAKHTKGMLENFNVSVLVTDDFMQAVEHDLDFDLIFNVPRADGNHVDVYEADFNGTVQTVYVYERVRAKELWNEIIRSTYEYAEPGVFFIDQVNSRNNLYYCEYLHACNPCGEQPLPANGACNLGAINLAKLVKDPFGNKPTFDYKALEEATAIGVRFLDNVLDVSLFPTPEQELEAQQKRRIGLGITGLGNALQMMKYVYGESESLRFIEHVMKTIRDTAYWTSVELAKERGPFPLFDRDKYCGAAFINTLPKRLRDAIYEHGIRNSVLLTIAPTGTTSMYYENVSSGCEPTIAWVFNRNAREADGSYREMKQVSDYGYYVFKQVTGHKHGDPLPPYMCSALQAPLVTIDQHLAVQATCQKFIDASISKTINCPADISFDDFKDVYTKGYKMGLKGLTTYRPSDVRGSVISVDEPKPEPVKLISPVIVPVQREEELEGTTYKVKYPGVEHAFYVTINDYFDEYGVRRPFEIFINTKSVQHQEWISALTRMISSIFRRGGDVTYIVEELKQVHGQHGAFVNKKFMPSLVALIGDVVEKHFTKIGLLASEELVTQVTKVFKAEEVTGAMPMGKTCPSCAAPTYFRTEGCWKCGSCGQSECG